MFVDDILIMYPLIEVEIHDGPYNVIKNWNYTALLVDAIHTGQGNCWNIKIIKLLNMLHSSQNFLTKYDTQT